MSNNQQTKAWRGLEVEITHSEARTTHKDTEGNPAYVLGTIVPTQHDKSVGDIYRKYWAMLNSWSFYYPVKLPIPLAQIAKNQGITVKGSLGDLWDWVEHPMARRTVSTWTVRDDELSKPREGNPHNLKKPKESGYWNGHDLTPVIKAVKVKQDNKLTVIIPEGCIDMYREMTDGFKEPSERRRGQQPMRYIREAIVCLHYWRVPICIPTVAMMVAYANKSARLPGHTVISDTFRDMGLVHTDTISATCTWLFNFPNGAEAYVPESLRKAYPHQRKGHFLAGQCA